MKYIDIKPFNQTELFKYVRLIEDDEERMDFNPSVFGIKYMFLVEHYIFNLAKKLLKEIDESVKVKEKDIVDEYKNGRLKNYNGGYWEFWEFKEKNNIGNKVGFYALDDKKRYKLISPNHYTVETNGAIVGLLITQLAVSHLLFDLSNKDIEDIKLTKFYYHIRNFIFEGNVLDEEDPLVGMYCRFMD